MSVSDQNAWFDHQKFEALRIENGVTWGRPLRAYETLPSTNDSALESITQKALTGIVFVANEQTKGRGRRGNIWSAAPGECLMLSLMVRYQGPVERLSGVSLVVGLCLRDLVQELLHDTFDTARDVFIKWPNDIMVDGKKLAGILVETRTESLGDYGIVIGVGLNTLCPEFPLTLRDTATSLSLLGVPAEQCRPEKLVVRLLQSLEARLPRFFQTGIANSAEELRACDYLQGKSLRVGNHSGQGHGLDDAGQLLLLQNDGQVVPVSSGHIEILSP